MSPFISKHLSILVIAISLLTMVTNSSAQERTTSAILKCDTGIQIVEGFRWLYSDKHWKAPADCGAITEATNHLEPLSRSINDYLKQVTSICSKKNHTWESSRTWGNQICITTIEYIYYPDFPVQCYFLNSGDIALRDACLGGLKLICEKYLTDIYSSMSKMGNISINIGIGPEDPCIESKKLKKRCFSVL